MCGDEEDYKEEAVRIVKQIINDRHIGPMELFDINDFVSDVRKYYGQDGIRQIIEMLQAG